MSCLLSWYHPQHGCTLSFPEITVLPWSSPSMSNLLQKLQCQSDLLLEFAIYFCSSSQCLWPVSTGFLVVIPRKASSLQGSLSSGSPFFLLSFGFCKLFLQVMSDSDFLVIGFSICHSPVKLLNMHHYIASIKTRRISIIWNIVLYRKNSNMQRNISHYCFCCPQWIF